MLPTVSPQATANVATRPRGNARALLRSADESMCRRVWFGAKSFAAAKFVSCRRQAERQRLSRFKRKGRAAINDPRLPGRSVVKSPGFLASFKKIGKHFGGVS